MDARNDFEMRLNPNQTLRDEDGGFAARRDQGVGGEHLQGRRSSISSSEAPSPISNESPDIAPIRDATVPLPESESTRNSLAPALKGYHVDMMAFSSVVGVGLFLQNGRVINQAGPGMATLSYPIMGAIIASVQACLGEMTALFPIPGAMFELPARFLDQAAGYAVGWMTWFAYVVVFAAELDAVAQLFKFGFDASYLNEIEPPPDSWQWRTFKTRPAAFVAAFWVLTVFFNIFPVLLLGWLEWLLGSLKMIFFIGLILFNVALTTMDRANPFRYYRDECNIVASSFTRTDGEVLSGGGARLAGVWTAMVATIFSMIGMESVSITAAENEGLGPNTTRSTWKQSGIRISTRKIYIRIIVLYTLATFVVTWNVPCDDKNISGDSGLTGGSGASSAFIIAAVRYKKYFWANFMNGFFILSATSAGINALYLSSRLLHALALSSPVWPNWKYAKKVQKRLAQTDGREVPFNAVIVSSLCGLLAYFAHGRHPERLLGRMALNSTVSILIVYSVLCLTYTRFKRTLKRTVRGTFSGRYGADLDVNKYNRNQRDRYPYRSRGQALKAWLAMIGCVTVVLTNGWQSVWPRFKAADFVASYIGLIIFLLIFVLYRIKHHRRAGFKFKFYPRLDLHGPTIVDNFRNENFRDRLIFNNEEGISMGNARAFAKWLWVWLF